MRSCSYFVFWYSVHLGVIKLVNSYTMVEKKLVLLVLLLYCLILLQQVNQTIMGDYRVRHYQRKLLFSQIVDITRELYLIVAPHELLVSLCSLPRLNRSLIVGHSPTSGKNTFFSWKLGYAQLRDSLESSMDMCIALMI